MTSSTVSLAHDGESTIPEFLRNVKGRVRQNVSLAKRCWFRVGGDAEYLVTPDDIDDLARLIANKPADMELHIIGVGSNLLVRDGGLDGLVVRLGRKFATIEALSNHQIKAGAAAMDVNVAHVAGEHGIAGLEFLVGIPGTIGGALRMNAGAYGTEIKDVLLYAEAIDAAGKLHQIPVDEMGFTYRHTQVPDDWIFTSAILQGKAGEKAQIIAAMDEISSSRGEAQPINARTGGSTFRNPEGHKAWQLVDDAGCRGFTIGGAQVSQKHCNFLINTGDATAADLENLGDEVKRRVKDTSGVNLHWEIKRIGKKL